MINSLSAAAVFLGFLCSSLSLFFLFLGYLNISREVFLISLYGNVASMLFEWLCYIYYLLAIFFFLG